MPLPLFTGADAETRTSVLSNRQVEEVACLIDFGVPADQLRAALPLFDELRQLSNISEEETLAEA